MANIDDIIDRVRKLLALSTSTNEHEAAAAATRAAQLMKDYQIEQAQLEVDDEDSVRQEPIVKHTIQDEGRNIITWKSVIAGACARDMGCKIYYLEGKTTFFGRTSVCQAVSYTYLYLVREIERLADSAWDREKETSLENGKSWKHSFKYGAATTVSARMREAKTIQDEVFKAQATASQEKALAVIAKHDNEVVEAYKVIQKGFTKRSSGGTGATVYSGFQHGQKAGAGISLGGQRGAIGAAPKQIK